MASRGGEGDFFERIAQLLPQLPETNLLTLFIGLAAFLALLEAPRVLPKSRIGEAIGYAANQWPTLVRYGQDGRLTIDNAPAEQAIRPLAVGRRNCLQIAGDGGVRSAAVLLSVAASAKQHGVNPWAYVQHVPSASAARPRAAEFSDLLPDAWAQAGGNP